MNKVKKTIFSLMMAGGIIVGGAVNAFAATGDNTLEYNSAYAWTHAAAGGGRIVTSVRVQFYNSFGSLITSGYATNETYGSSSNGVTNYAGTTVTGAHSQHTAQNSLESNYFQKYRNWK